MPRGGLDEEWHVSRLCVCIYVYAILNKTEWYDLEINIETFFLAKYYFN